MTASAHSEIVPHSETNSDYGVPFETVLAEVHRRADLSLPDQVVQMSDLHATDEGEIEVPNLGILSLTEWSRRQLSGIVGIRWAKWFSGDLVAPEEQAEELNRRFARSTGTFRIRARRYEPEESGTENGVLRGLVGRGYTPTDDRVVFDRLEQVLGSRIQWFRFVRSRVTATSSQYAAVSVKTIDLGIRSPDHHRHGFLIGNSEVGARALSIHVYVHRLVCTNGLVVSDSRLLYWIHRARRRNDLHEKLDHALALLPEQWERGIETLRAARREAVADPATQIRSLLEGVSGLRRHAEAAIAAFAEDPEATRFGMVQALTRAARGLIPEDGLLLEELAGRVAAGQHGVG